MIPHPEVASCRYDEARVMPQGRRQALHRHALPDDGVVRIMRERRRASSVSIVTGLSSGELAEVAKELKHHCGSGGTAKNGVVEIQGDHRDKIARWFAERGRTVKLAGG